MNSLPKVITDIPGKPGRFWNTHTQCITPTHPPRWLVRLVGSARAHDLCGTIAAVRLFLRRKHCEGVVTDGGASGQLFALLQTIVPWGRKRHVMVDCNWYRSASPLAHWFKRLRLRMIAGSVERFVVWASHEVEDYARAFGLPVEKLEYVPFHTTLDDFEYQIRDEGYLFAGGNYDRDYPLLIEAVRELNISTWIATTRSEWMSNLHIPSHVRVQGTSVAGFRQAMAAARLVVVPMAAGRLHSGGQQTALNAMYMGKPTICVGPKWGRDLITDGEDGMLVEYGDVLGLRRAIRWVIDHPLAAARMGQRAAARAAWFTTERTMRQVYALATNRPEMRLPDGPSTSRFGVEDIQQLEELHI
ncbi:MAG: glycosyltransferase [Gemmataceae bacterium]